MTRGRGFVTAFAGRRDSYQVPLALAEAGRLEQLLTSGYRTGLARAVARVLPGSVGGQLAARDCPGLPAGRVTARWDAELVEQLGRRLGLSPPGYWANVNRTLSRAAGAWAERARADLLLYEPYAVEAFARRYPRHTPRKVLFHFHPHPAFEAEALARDTRQSGFAFDRPTPDGGGNRDPHNLQVRQVWRRADLILCASTVTKRSLVFAGARPDVCRVVPYGVDAPESCPAYLGGDRYRVLFVGSGIQRKGLHHLLKAWPTAGLPGDAELTLVCRTIDPALERLARATPDVTLLRGVSAGELRDHFRRSDLFALPSLLEGFGLSYLEALAEGCPVLGTDATGVPDLLANDNGVTAVPTGDVESLAAALHAGTSAVGNLSLRERAWATARRFPWSRFRGQLRGELA